MRGFQPQHFADGGLVQGFKRAFGMDEERNARVAAYRAQQAQEKAQQQAAAAPASAPAPQRAITEYAGDSAMKRREKAAGLADGGTVKPRGFKAGGLIRGPGTGTSDSIETEKRPGTFIMPADSTKAIGPETLEEMGEMDEGDMEEQGEKMPVRLSAGEFELPPEQVQALGEAVLTVMRDATHKPVRGFAPQAEPEEPRQFFSNGGVVKRKPEPGIFPNNHQDAGANIYANVGLPSSPPSARAAGPSELYMADRAQEIGEQWKAGNYAGAVGTGLRTAVQGLGMYGIEAADKALSPVIDASQRLVGGVLGTDTPSGAVKPSIAPPATPPAPSSAAAKATPVGAPSITPQTDVQRGGGNVPAVAPPSTNPAAPSPAATGAEIAPGVYRHGRGQYSDNASGMAFPAGFTGQPNAQNLAAADNLARGFVPGGNASPAVGGGSASAPAGITAPTVRNSTNDWAARKALENAATAASSITANGGRFDQNGRAGSPQAAAYRAALANDFALQQAQPGMDQAAMRENGGLQREALQQQGGLQREQVQQAGANTRASASNAVDQRRVGLEEQVRGFDIREGQRKEQLFARYDAAKTPEEKAAVAQQIRDLSGKQTESPWKVQVTPTTKNADSSTSEGSVIRYNTQTGAVELVDTGKQLPPIDQNPKAAAIKADTKLSREQKAAELKKLGY